MKKYGLQLRGRPPVAPPAVKKPSIFNDDNDDDEDVEQNLAREAARKRALKEVEVQHKAALEQDSTVFDYDGYYDEMKAKVAPRVEDRAKEKPKYITALVEKAKFRKMEQEIVYERKLLKERQQEDHLYGDKEKFVTTAYKKKLAELEKWNEEERRRQMREEADDVTKKGDLGDFYRNLLSKNVAFGASAREKNTENETSPELRPVESSEKSPDMRENRLSGITAIKQTSIAPDSDVVRESEETSLKETSKAEQISQSGATVAEQSATTEKTDRRPSKDAISSAMERYLARKRLRTE